MINTHITPRTLGALLFGIHAHAEQVDIESSDQIVYREKDIILLLNRLGYPSPQWGDYIDLKKWDGSNLPEPQTENL